MADRVVSIPIPGSALNIDAGRVAKNDSLLPLREFLIGPENRLVLVAIDAVLEGAVPQFQPIVLHGPAGCGKSHLAHGLVSIWRSRFRDRSAVYVTGADFARELADALETRTIDDFHARFRGAGFLAIDDLHLLAGKPAAQRELIPAIDAVADGGGRVVVTSLWAPERLTGIAPDLQSRLVGGLAVPLALPTAETRRAIVRRLAATRQLDLGDDVTELLADHLDAPVPLLAGAILQLEAEARLAGRAIGVEAVQQLLAARSALAVPSLREIAMAAAQHFAVRLSDLRSPSRRRAVVTARDVAMYLARALTNKSLREIGSYFAGRDHTTVSHGCHKTQKLLESDPAIRTAVEQLRDRLRPTPR
ncbi:MAG: DnaA/Hda family protein [Thermoguttaceae bacterium]|nr:DnaA/Hda family protein [Thermoguttaceae bacterium]